MTRCGRSGPGKVLAGRLMGVGGFFGGNYIQLYGFLWGETGLGAVLNGLVIFDVKGIPRL